MPHLPRLPQLGRTAARRQPPEGTGPSVRTLSRRVAFTTTVIVAVAYAAIAVVVAIIVSRMLLAGIDARLQGFVLAPGGGPRIDGGERPPGDVPDPTKLDPGGIPLLQWSIESDGTAVPRGINSLALPAAYATVSAPTTVSIDGQDYRLAGGTDRLGRRLVVARSLADVADTEGALVKAEIGIGAALVVAVFLGATAIGRRVAQPIEDARQRQLEFTADASHELRTPLSVIEAQTTLALARERDPEWYRTAFVRVDGESKRIRRLVDDMLWLARFDATRGRPDAEPVDVNVLAAATADRFRAVAETRRVTLAVDGDDDAIVTVPPEWLDRLLGVLLDNACKYSTEGGAVRVSVSGDGRRVRLTVEDSGPGIPPAERERIFHRFHRATEQPGGAGLGLAIGDAIVKATNGRWQIGDSELGGASISVTWPRSISAGAGRRESHAEESSRPAME